MTPEERQLISGLFDRMRGYGAPDKDREAEALIAQSIRANPDATYMLVQSVLIQEQALEASAGRVQELEDQLRAMEGGGEPRGSRSGSFLGGAWNSGRRGEEPRSSVPQVGARATPSAYESRSPWSQGGATQSQPQPQPQAQQQAPAPSGGGFMKSALATAAGVAGGMVLADSLRGMLGGGAHASPSSMAGPREGADAKYQDASDNDPGTDNDPGSDDADNDPGFDSGGSDDGIEI
jgi:hypothetical protein